MDTVTPPKGWHRFTQGLVVFALGFITMLAGAWWWFPLYYAGIVILLCGFGWAMTGYLALLWFRLTKNINPARRND
ncbi:hypothetical protein [Alteromonas sp. AMM-1]|uniref:hypothetical protein n=1 Tax=Alteromonas sp. AMM-1 TaxID=3394233 RepID=UPI0039A47416